MLTNSRTLCIVTSFVLIFSVMLPANCASFQHNNLHRNVRSEPEKVIEKTTERASIKIASIKTAEQSKVEPLDLSGCAGDIPCGWALYEIRDGEKTVIDFMPNTCTCDKVTKQCIKTDENMSINAFVYRCRDNTQ